MTHDYKRHGTTTSDFACRNQTSISTLFAALNVLDGTVTGRNMQRHRHQEFIRFLNTLDREIHAAVDALNQERNVDSLVKWRISA